LLDLAARYDEEIASEANRLSFKRTASSTKAYRSSRPSTRRACQDDG
jgi:hypothetical protein